MRVRISVAADERAGIADALIEELRRRGHERGQQGRRDPRGAVRRCANRRGRASLERRQRSRAEPPGDVRGGARRDPRCLVRVGTELRRRRPRQRRAPGPHRAQRLVERLLPDPGPTTPAEQYSGLGLVELAHPDRPYVVTNFALTLDGRATIDGRSAPIGDRTDSEVLHRLRTQVDAVMIGTDSLDLPWDAGLFTAGFGRVLIFTSSDAEIPDTATKVRVERHRGRVDLRRAMSRLHDERGVRAVLCEGGPHLHANLVSAGLVDEMFITLAPKLGLNDGPGLLEDGFGDLGPTVLELVWLLAEDGELFTRYRLRR